MENKYYSILEQKAIQIKSYNRGNEMIANHQKHLVSGMLKRLDADCLDGAYAFFVRKEKELNSMIKIELQWEAKNTVQKARQMYDLFVKKYASFCLKKEVKALKDELAESKQ